MPAYTYDDDHFPPDPADPQPRCNHCAELRGDDEFVAVDVNGKRRMWHRACAEQHAERRLPEPGFYWAKCDVNGGDDWTVVEVTTTFDFYGKEIPHVACLDYEAGCNVLEWGPKLTPPGGGGDA